MNCVRCGIELLVTQFRIHKRTCSNNACEFFKPSTKTFDEHVFPDDPDQSIEVQ